MRPDESTPPGRLTGDASRISTSGNDPTGEVDGNAAQRVSSSAASVFTIIISFSNGMSAHCGIRSIYKTLVTVQNLPVKKDRACRIRPELTGCRETPYWFFNAA
jgi:hypothetical protein